MSHVLLKRGLTVFAKSIHPYQPTQSVQADIGRIILLSIIILPDKGPFNLRIQSALNPFTNKLLFSCICCTSLENTVGKGVFYPFGELFVIFIKIILVVCNLFQCGRVYNLLYGKRLNNKDIMDP